jgi:hypothetical protein
MTSVPENALDWLNLLLCRLSELELPEAGFLLLNPPGRVLWLPVWLPAIYRSNNMNSSEKMIRP